MTQDLLTLDHPTDRTAGVGVAFALLLDQAAKDWHDELAFEHERAVRAFGHSMFDLTDPPD